MASPSWLAAHLEVYHHCKNKNGSDEVHEVRQVLPVEGLSEGADLVSASGQKMKERNDCPLKFSPWAKETGQYGVIGMQTRVIYSAPLEHPYLGQCLQWLGWRLSRQLSRRCWWQWRVRYLSRDRSPSGGAHPAAKQSDLPQTAENKVWRLFCMTFYRHRLFFFFFSPTWIMMSRHIPAPISEGSPYMPVMTYTIACPMVMIIPNTVERHQGGRQSLSGLECVRQTIYRNFQKGAQWRKGLRFWAPLKRALSFGVSPTSIILAPASSCIMRPEVTIGEIPSSIRVPEGTALNSQQHKEQCSEHTKRDLWLCTGCGQILLN